MQTTWITQVAFKPCNPPKRQRDQSQRILLTYDINKPIKFYFSFIEQKLNQIKKFDQSVFNCPALKLLVTKTAPTYFYNRKVGFIFRGSIRVSLCKNYFAESPSNFAFERSMLLIELNHQTCLEFFVLCQLSFPPWRV